MTSPAKHPDASPLHPDTQDWLRAQAAVHHLTVAAVNAISIHNAHDPRGWAYRLLPTSPQRWRGFTACKPQGPHTRCLATHLPHAIVTLADLQRALRAMDEPLAQAPADLPTRPVEVHAGHALPTDLPEHPLTAELRRRLTGLDGLATVYLHGSFADHTATAFSDVDDLVILHRQAWRDLETFTHVVRTLNRCAAFFQQCDPLQHHGHWLYLAHDLAGLDAGVMPPQVLGTARTLVGQAIFTARLRTDAGHLPFICSAIADEVRQGYRQIMTGRISLFDLKNLLSGVALLPALQAQVLGQPLDKRTALARAADLFPEEALPALTWSTQLRQAWDHCPGYARIACLRQVYAHLPCRRPVLELWSRRLAPVLTREEIPGFTAAVRRGLVALTDQTRALPAGPTKCVPTHDQTHRTIPAAA